MSKQRIFVYLVVSICLLFTACSKSTESADTDKTVVLCESWDFAGGNFYPLLTPGTSSTYGFCFWAVNCYDTLVTYNTEGKIVGKLAKSWDISDDGLTYTFHLRENVKFSDGTAVNAEVVKQTFDSVPLLLGPYNGSYGKLTAIIASTQAVDETTFVLTLTQPYYAALNDMTQTNPLAIVNPKVFANGLENAVASTATQTAGSGPYMYESYDGNGTYTFVRNPNYWGAEPEVNSFKIKVIPDNEAKVLALRNGEIDMITGIDKMSYDAYKELSQDKKIYSKLAERDYKTFYLGMNLSRAPFDDIKVRQAVAYAINQQMISESVFNGMESAAETLFSPMVPYCDVKQTTYETNLEKAKSLLDEASWIDSDGDGVREKDGKKLTINLSYMNTLASNEGAMLTTKSELEAAGFSVSLTGGDMMTFYTTVLSGNYDMAYWYTNGGVFDPSSVVTNMSSVSSTDPISCQYSAFFEGGNDLIAELDSTSDTNRIKEIYNIILKAISDNCLAVPVSYNHEAILANASLVSSYDFPYDAKYITISNIKLK